MSDPVLCKPITASSQNTKYKTIMTKHSKRTLILIILFISVVSYVCCSQEDNIASDESSNRRVDEAYETIQEAKKVLEESKDLDTDIEAKLGSVDLVLLKTMSDSYDSVKAQSKMISRLIYHLQLIAEENEIVEEMESVVDQLSTEKKDQFKQLTRELASNLVDDLKNVRTIIAARRPYLISVCDVYEKSMNQYFRDKQRTKQLDQDDEANMRSELTKAKRIIDLSGKLIE